MAGTNSLTGSLPGFAETKPPRHQEHQGIIRDEPLRRKERKDRYYLLRFHRRDAESAENPIIMVSALSALNS
jgi:hypothetical protein